MRNANNELGARIPRNALRVWHSNELYLRNNSPALTASLRLNIPGSPNLVHPADWPSDRLFDALTFNLDR